MVWSTQMMRPNCMWQIQEPLLLLGKERFAGVDIRVRVKGGGRVSQIYGMLLAAIYVQFT